MIEALALSQWLYWSSEEFCNVFGLFYPTLFYTDDSKASSAALDPRRIYGKNKGLYSFNPPEKSRKDNQVFNSF